MDEGEMQIHEKVQYYNWVKEKAADIRNGRCPHHMVINFDSREGSGGYIHNPELNIFHRSFDEVVDYVASDGYIVYGVMSTYVFAMGKYFFYCETTA